MRPVKQLSKLMMSVLLLLAGTSASAWASCMCISGPPCQMYWTAAAVFSGTVTEISSSELELGEGENRWPYKRIVARFAVEQAYRGVRGRVVEIVVYRQLPKTITTPQGQVLTSSSSGGDCGYKFKQGEQYLVYAYSSSRNNELTAHGCSRTRPLAEASEDLEFLNGISKLAPGGRIFGVVQHWMRDLQTGDLRRPPGIVADVKVSFKSRLKSRDENFEAVTGSDGRYELTGLPPGEYEARISLPEHLTMEGSGVTKVTVIDRGCAETNFNVETNSRISGTVLDAEGRPVPEIKVDLIIEEKATDLRGQWALTDKEGRYELKWIPPGRYVLGVNLSNAPDTRAPYPHFYYPGVATREGATVISLDEGGRLREYDLRLPPPMPERLIEGTVFWPDGRPAAGAIVLLEDDEYYPWQSSMSSATADERGRFTVKGYEGRPYWVKPYISLNDGQQRHAEPVRLTTTTGPIEGLKFIITSQYGNCPHYRGGRGTKK